MRSILKILSTKNRDSIPSSWEGEWVDKNGKRLIVESRGAGLYHVSILSKEKDAFKIHLLNDQTTTTCELEARFTKDVYKNPILQVEAGVLGIGPTYNLYFLKRTLNKGCRLARNNDDLNKIIVRPSVGIGLYDDWEDDLGVPWAFPLEDFKKEKNTNR